MTDKNHGGKRSGAGRKQAINKKTRMMVDDRYIRLLKGLSILDDRELQNLIKFIYSSDVNKIINP